MCDNNFNKKTTKKKLFIMLCKCCCGCSEPRCSSRSMKIHWGSHCSSLRASLFSRLNGIPALLNLLLFQKQYCAIHNMPRLCLQRRENEKKTQTQPTKK